MRKLPVISVLAALALTVFWLGAIGVEPKDRRPGTRLAGEVRPLPDNWQFSDAVQEVHVETHPWWGIPYSVTVVLGRDGNVLYSPSIYDAPAEFPGSKFWNKIIAQNPNVRLRIGDALYELDIKHVADPEEHDVGLAALARKYPFWQTALDDPSKRPPFVILRFEPRAG